MGAGCTRLGGVFSQLNLMPFVVQNLKQEIADAEFVVNHQDCCHIAVSVQVELRICESK